MQPLFHGKNAKEPSKKIQVIAIKLGLSNDKSGILICFV